MVMYIYFLQAADKFGGAIWSEEMVSNSSDVAWKNRKAV